MPASRVNRPLPQLPPRPVRDLPPPQAEAARAASSPSKPDARPMRVVYGAGAVAALSVMAVGLVQPDYAATADQTIVSDPAADPHAGAAAPANGDVRHVTRYIYLKPGQTAPPGATVIAANAPKPRVVVTHNSTGGGGGGGGTVSQPAPKPAPPKPVTRQSGRP